MNYYRATQLNMIILVVFIGSLFFFEHSPTIVFQIILAIVIAYVIFVSWQLCSTMRHQDLSQARLQKLNRDLNESQGKSEKINNDKNEFLAFATHQLRSPLTSLKWGLNTVSDAVKDNASTVKVVAQLETIVDDMISTVNDFLDISKIEQGGLTLQNESMDLTVFLQRITNEFRMTAASKGLTISCVMKIPRAIISGDPMKLRQVFMNIIDNAIKYTDQGSIMVTVQESGDGQKFIIEITDTGAGIPPDELAKLFGKFVRGTVGKSSTGGSGLGLYLSQKIVELYHGQISVSSPGSGKGSTFAVVLPKNES